ncbi:MAG: site-specific DNA-methyltransferase [Deltaproteobacteria bacterium]|nr:site-specific DNA-methyltransferase [Deltaproteobacteria bacterium]
MPEKMDLRSMDVGADNRAKLKQLFPTVFSETRNEKGELVESIDFEKLKAELGTFSDFLEARRERYGMDWPGKKDCIKLIQQPSIATLKPCREESVDFDTTENLFIEGDNLEVLKLLQKSYYGKVKMIYIDPPYNTGNEFIYPDDYAESLETYLAYAGLVDDEGKKFSTNTPNEGRFHTKWLNMMWPRLYLARNLLRDDGVIFISIDDNEVSNLRKVCDEIFGEENFKADVIWQKRYTRSNNTIDFTAVVEHMLIYAKSESFIVNLLPRTEKTDSRYSNPDNDRRGPWKGASFLNPASPQQRPNLCYPIENPNTGEITHPTRNAWRRSKEEFERLKAQNRLYWGPDGKQSVPSRKMFLSEARSLTPINFWPYEYAGSTDDGTKDLERLVPGKVFNNPKPIKLIERIIEHSCAKDSLILDFFCGSSSAAHAVLDFNWKDGGNRKFIMVQIPEPCDEKSEAYKAGYKTIADIGKKRIRRVIKKIKKEQAEKANDPQSRLPGLEEEQPELDLGFKVLKLDKSNFKVWDGSKPNASEEELEKQLELHIDHIDPKASQEDILFELLLKAGFMPTEKVEKRALAGKTVFSVGEGALLICLENEITRELIDSVAESEPMQFICLDRGFQGNDQLKANAVQTFAARNQGRDKAEQIVFRTV